MSESKPQVLLIDDDELVIRGLRRSLKRAGWDVKCATSVSEGLHLAETQPFDIALVDVLMEEGGAVGFYTGVQERRLPLPMVMMSGARSILDVAKASLRSVLFLEKPFSIEEANTTLKQAIADERSRPVETRTIAQQTEDVLAKSVKSTADIPSLDPTLAGALPLFRSQTSKVTTLTALLARDAAATTALLRAANSAAYAAKRRIATIEEAFVRVGQDEVAELVLEITLRRVLSLRRAPYAAIGRRLWQQSVATAVAARALAKQLPAFGINPSLAYTAGLLHNIGESVALRALADANLPVDEAAIAKPIADYHQAIGALVLQHWQVPAPLPAIAGRHHAPALAEENEPLRQLVLIAHVFAENTGCRGVDLEEPITDLKALAAEYRIPDEILDRVMAEIKEKMMAA